MQADNVDMQHKPEEHSVNGMPQCRHCGLKLCNWQALKGHVLLNVYAAGTVHHHSIGKQDKHRHKQGRQTTPRANTPQAAFAEEPAQAQDAGVQNVPKDALTLPLLQQPSVLDNVQSHDGIISQAALHKEHLRQLWALWQMDTTRMND